MRKKPFARASFAFTSSAATSEVSTDSGPPTPTKKAVLRIARQNSPSVSTCR